jgi:hypothetical protein
VPEQEYTGSSTSDNRRQNETKANNRQASAFLEILRDITIAVRDVTLHVDLRDRDADHGSAAFR